MENNVKDIRPYRVESKPQHKKVLDEVVKQKARGELVNKGKAIRGAGYSETTAQNPKAVFDTKGFQQLLDDKLKDTNLVDYLVTDLGMNEGNRLGYLKLAFELKGQLTNKVDISVHQEVDEQLVAMKEIIDEVKEDSKN